MLIFSELKNALNKLEVRATEWAKEEIVFEAVVKFVITALLNMCKDICLMNRNIESQHALIEAEMKKGSDAENVPKVLAAVSENTNPSTTAEISG
jgi:hypothetical protein